MKNSCLDFEGSYFIWTRSLNMHLHLLFQDWLRAGEKYKRTGTVIILFITVHIIVNEVIGGTVLYEP